MSIKSKQSTGACFVLYQSHYRTSVVSAAPAKFLCGWTHPANGVEPHNFLNFKKVCLTKQIS